uniref:Uncharacterized protein n=1 Tax=Triticum urartu TaxID=4572 RepID=A0A8R7R9P0_TRIUA
MLGVYCYYTNRSWQQDRMLNNQRSNTQPTGNYEHVYHQVCRFFIFLLSQLHGREVCLICFELIARNTCMPPTCLFSK